MANIVKSMTMCKCSFGGAPMPLIVPPAAMVLVCGMPAACIMDNKIATFGTCANPANPAVAAAMGAPMPCTPVLVPWVPGSPTVMIGGKPALNTSSTMMCAYPGGIITIMANTAALTVTVP